MGGRETQEGGDMHIAVVDVSGDESKIRCFKEQYCIGTWNTSPRIKVDWMGSSRRW